MMHRSKTPNRAGRPTAARAGEIDAAIRRAARQRFLDKGFGATRMDDIAVAAAVSKGTVYTRYASKEALFRAVVEDVVDSMSRRAAQQDHLLSDDLELRLRHHARVLLSVYGWKDYRLATRMISDASRAFPEIAMIWEELGTRRYIDFLAADMAAASRLPPGSGPDWTMLANIFLHSITGWYHQQTIAGRISEQETDAYCRKVIGAIMTVITVGRGQS
jgi:TetR/AcrR family transcriptional repressor of mexJK operon